MRGWCCLDLREHVELGTRTSLSITGHHTVLERHIDEMKKSTCFCRVFMATICSLRIKSRVGNFVQEVVAMNRYFFIF